MCNADQVHLTKVTRHCKVGSSHGLSLALCTQSLVLGCGTGACRGSVDYY